MTKIKEAIKKVLKGIAIISICYTLKNIKLYEVYSILTWCGLIGGVWFFAWLDSLDNNHGCDMSKSSREIHCEVTKDNTI